jgi:hypothetical protein
MKTVLKQLQQFLCVLMLILLLGAGTSWNWAVMPTDVSEEHDAFFSRV